MTAVRNGLVARVLGPFQEFARTGALGGIEDLDVVRTLPLSDSMECRCDCEGR